MDFDVVDKPSNLRSRNLGMGKEPVNQSYRQFSADLIEASGKDYTLHMLGETAPRQLKAREFDRREDGAHPLH